MSPPSPSHTASGRTVARSETLSGITLFTGVQSSITIRPASSGGIVFRRTDLAGEPRIPATVAHVVPEFRRTVLSTNPADKSAPTVQTTEHLMSALAGLGITDALIDVAGPEIPIGDGSARPFVEAILAAGFAPASSAPLAPAIVLEPIILDDGKSRLEARPRPAAARPGLDLTYILEYPPGAAIPAQSASIFIPRDSPAQGYAVDVAPARTFCLVQEAQAMRQMGMLSHLSPREMLVIGEHGPIDNAYRFDNEPARHKLLDLLGDLALAARPINASITATRTGHAHNHAMARALAAL
jgi:UDP-3-O-[3-hydroxymyristoyl] N-acetylglucosamine deacetylase